MKAVQLFGYGDVSQLKLVDLPDPVAGDDEIVVEVEAAGVVFADILMRHEGYPFQPPFPYLMGREVAGRILSKGRDVGEYSVGDRVYGFLMGGGYAEKAAVPVKSQVGPSGQSLGRAVYPLGPGVSAAQAIAHGQNLRVAHIMLHCRAQARPGQTILIHAASGGVGIHLVRLAHEHGMKVIALVGSPEKARYCLANGADHAIEYKTCDYAEKVKELTGGRGADISMNSIGADTLMKDAQAMAWEGQIVITGFTAGKGSVTPSAAGKALTYKHFASYIHFGRPEDDAACAYVAKEMLHPTHEDRIVTFSLAEAGAAHNLLESGQSYGKIVLVP